MQQRILMFLIGVICIPSSSLFMSMSEADMAAPYDYTINKEEAVTSDTFVEQKSIDVEDVKKEYLSALINQSQEQFVAKVVVCGGGVLLRGLMQYYVLFPQTGSMVKNIAKNKPHFFPPGFLPQLANNLVKPKLVKSKFAKLYIVKKFKESHSHHEETQEGWKTVESEKEIPEHEQKIIKFDALLFDKKLDPRDMPNGGGTDYTRNGDILEVSHSVMCPLVPCNTMYYKLIKVEEDCINKEEVEEYLANLKKYKEYEDVLDTKLNFIIKPACIVQMVLTGLLESLAAKVLLGKLLPEESKDWLIPVVGGLPGTLLHSLIQKYILNEQRAFNKIIEAFKKEPEKFPLQAQAILQKFVTQENRSPEQIAVACKELRAIVAE